MTATVNSQVKVGNNGYVGIGSSATPSYMLDVNSGYNRFLYTSTQYINFNLWSLDPRIEAKSAIVFYNTSTPSYINIQCKTLYEYSDKSEKENILSLKGKGLEKILLLNGVSYNWKSKSGLKDANTKKEIGFLAQEVEAILPEVVYTVDSTQKKMLSYNHIIPLLTEAIKELNDKVIVLENELKKGSQKSGNISDATVNTDGLQSNAVLYQNSPNPFNESTIIKYVLPIDCLSATINIFDMQDQPRKNIQLSTKGEGEVQINASELNAGMYFYVLIVDGKIIDSKNMILTNN